MTTMSNAEYSRYLREKAKHHAGRLEMIRDGEAPESGRVRARWITEAAARIRELEALWEKARTETKGA